MKYVIIGGDAAGMSAAMQIMKYDQSAHITILEKGNYYSYGQCGLPYLIGGVVKDEQQLVARDVDVYRDQFGMDAKVGHEVTNINTESKIVSGKDLENGSDFFISYDRLLIATGADPFVPKWPGRELDGVHTLKTIPDALDIQQKIDDVQDVTIVGGGYIALEMAENFHRLGKKVRLLIRSDQMMRGLDKEISKQIESEANNYGIEVAYEEEIKTIIGEQGVEKIQTNKRTFATDLVLVATGIRPNTNFLENTNIKRMENGAIFVNKHLQTNVQDVYAAGDCATQYHRLKKQSDYVALGTHANKQGRIAGMNMANKNREYRGIVGTSILQFMGLAIGKSGLSEGEAEKLSIPYDTIMMDVGHIASYYPGMKKLSIKIIYRTDNGLLLGGQLIGEAGVDKRIDVIATALFNQMTVRDLEDLDVSYAPPFNGVYDPIQQVARKATSQLEE